MEAIYYESSLCHHGIKGQKWGVRRFRNEDGSLTSAGRKRYSDDGDNESRGMSSGTKKKVAAGVATGAAVGAAAILTAYAIKDPKVRDFVKNAASKTFSKTKEFVTSEKTKAFVKEKGGKAVKAIGTKICNAGNAMSDALLVSMGGVAISRLAKKLEVDDNASDDVKDRNKVILDVATAGIKALPGGSNSSNNKGGSNKGGSVGKDISDALGAPSKKSVDKSSSDYQGLFKDSNGNQRDPDTRATIKSLASAGYDIDQIKEYVRKVDNGTLKHSYDDVRDELNYLSAVRYVDYILS